MATTVPAPARNVVGGYMLHALGQVREAEADCVRAGGIGAEAASVPLRRGRKSPRQHTFFLPQQPQTSSTRFSLPPPTCPQEGQQNISEEYMRRSTTNFTPPLSSHDAAALVLPAYSPGWFIYGNGR